MNKILPILLLCFVSLNSQADTESRITGFQDDNYGTWFTFSYSKDDTFTLSFAGSGPARGILISEGEYIANIPILCLI